MFKRWSVQYICKQKADLCAHSWQFGSLLPHELLTVRLVPTLLSSLNVLAPVRRSPGTTILSQRLQLLWSNTQIGSFTSMWNVHLVSQNLLQLRAVGFGEGFTLRDGIRVMDTHRLEERGSQMFGGVESQVKSAEHRQRAARLTIRGGGQLWNRLLLEQTHMQKSTYGVRGSGR